jgi:uncharacterized LabA/DUF88 family protein
MFPSALLIDGGYLRAIASKSGIHYTPDFIEKFARRCYDPAKEDLRRILYYDCAQYRGKQTLPVSGRLKEFQGSDKWLDDLAERELFAVRKGVLAFRGWQPRRIPIAGDTLSDEDFKPIFEQKGVDMRVGLDIAVISATKTIQRIILVSSDTDMIPAMKHGRKEGVQIVVVQLPMPAAQSLAPRILHHSDFKRLVGWPT